MTCTLLVLIFIIHGPWKVLTASFFVVSGGAGSTPDQQLFQWRKISSLTQQTHFVTWRSASRSTWWVPQSEARTTMLGSTQCKELNPEPCVCLASTPPTEIPPSHLICIFLMTMSLIFLAYTCVHVCANIHVGANINACVCTWRPEVDVGCFLCHFPPYCF